MYAYRYSFNEGMASITVGAWDPDRWPDEEYKGGHVWGMTADVHAHGSASGAVTVTVNQGSMQVTPAEAIARAAIYVNAAEIGAWIERLLADGKTLTEIGESFAKGVNDGKPVDRLVPVGWRAVGLREAS